MVGVDYKDGSPNVDGMTDHFVLISGKTETVANGEVTSKTYNFYDPRTAHSNYGTSSKNKFSSSNGRWAGTYNHGGSNFNYIMTTVRRKK